MARQDARRKAHEYLRTITTLPGVKYCGAAPRYGATSLGMRLREWPDGSRKANLVDVQKCRSQCCPECVAETGSQHALEIEAVTRHVIGQGGSVIHLVTTLGHEYGDDPRSVWSVLQSAFEHVTDSREWGDMRAYGPAVAVEIADVQAEYAAGRIRQPERNALVREIRDEAGESGAPMGLWAYVRAAEGTWGQSHGWHPHLHVLLFFRGKVSQKIAARMQEMIYRRYLAGLTKNGATASRERGVRLEVATTRRDAAGLLGRYLNKIALEIGRPDLKRAKRGKNGEIRWSPMTMLEAMAADPDGVLPQTAHLRRAWGQWEAASKGRARITHGGDWDALLEAATVPEADEGAPAEIPGAGQGPDDVVPDTIDFVSLDEFYRVVRPGWVELAAVAERDGWPGAFGWLEDHGVEWRWRLPVAPSGPPGECSAGGRPDAHRTGRCGCWRVVGSTPDEDEETA